MDLSAQAASDGDVCLVFGAGSEIALAIARKLASAGFRLVLVNRSPIDVEKHGLPPEAIVATHYGVDYTDAEAVADQLRTVLGRSGLSHVLICQGVMHTGRYDDSEIVEMYMCNVVSVALMLEALFRTELRPREVIVVGSIAGDRGKEKNPVYDSSKAGLEVLCQGYRQRFAHRNTRLLFVKPGNVSTRMTKDKAKDWTFSRPERIASDVYRAMDRGGGVIYSPRIWGAVMFVIRKLPETLFVKMGFGRAN
jgi:NAD(P)-dependent dehydrogenase (short-subunit alcohol dehydrogenase family)